MRGLLAAGVLLALVAGAGQDSDAAGRAEQVPADGGARVAPPKAPREADALFEAARTLLVDRPDAAVVKLERCVKLSPTSHRCYKLLGSAYARIHARDSDADAFRKGLAAYRRFLELAPADDPAVPKVKRLVEDAEAQRW